jgi:hypothetical protein
MAKMQTMLLRALRQQTDKKTMPEIGQSNTQPILNTIIGDGERTLVGIGISTGRAAMSIPRTQSQDTLQVNTEEYNRRIDYVREMRRRQDQLGNSNNFRMSRIEFPRYEGEDPIE